MVGSVESTDSVDDVMPISFNLPLFSPNFSSTGMTLTRYAITRILTKILFMGRLLTTLQSVIEDKNVLCFVVHDRVSELCRPLALKADDQ